jgi:hypothetical protein
MYLLEREVSLSAPRGRVFAFLTLDHSFAFRGRAVTELFAS